MVDEVITKQELIDAQKDAQSLDDFINGSDEQVVITRLLKEYPTLANAIRQIYEKGGKFYPTLAAANADIANIRTDVYVITGDNGAYYKATSEATSLTKSPFDPLVQAKQAIPQNLLFDPFNETVKSNFTDSLQSARNADFSSITTNPLNPFVGKPVLRANDGAQARRYLDTKKLGLVVGSVFYVRVCSHFVNPLTTGSVGVFLRKADNTTIQQISKSAVSGLNDMLFGPFTVSVDPEHLLVAISGPDVKDLLAISVSENQNPRFIYGAIDASFPKNTVAALDALTQSVSTNTTSLAATLINAIPDPFFRAYRAGITSIDGYSLFDDVASSWSVVDYPTSPFSAKNAFFSNTSGSRTKTFKFSRLGVKVGDTITLKVGIVAKANVDFQIGCYVRDASNAVIGTAVTSTKSLVADVYSEMQQTVTITQAMMDNGVICQARLNVDGKLITGGWYCLGMALHVNNITAPIRDTSTTEDELRLLIKNTSPITATPHTFGDYYLRETHQRLQKRKLNESAKLTIASIGDSWTHNRDRWCQPVAQSLMTQFGDGGGGWTGFANHPDVPALVNGNVRSTYTMVKAGTWTSAYGSSPSPDACHAISSEVGAKITCTTPSSPNISGCDLFYIGTSSGQVRYRVNGGAWTALSLSGVAVGAIGIHTISGFATGAQTLEVEIVGGTCNLAGVNWKSSDDGVVWHKLAASGSSAYQWTGLPRAAWKTAIQSLSPNLVTIMHGTNDQTIGRTPVQFSENIATIINDIRAVLPLVDILVVMPCENNRVNNPVAMADYASAVYEMCKTNKCAFLDLQKDFGDNPSEYASTSVRNWMNADLIHPDPLTGGRAIVSALLRFILN